MKKINYSIQILERAQNDLRDARKYYNKLQNGLGKRFLNDAKMAIKALQDNPEGFQTRYRTIRMAHLSIFPYSIHFEIIDYKIVILAVTHSHINPQKWP